MNKYPCLPELKSYLDNLTAEQRRDFATRLEVTVVYLTQLHIGFRRASAGMAVKIERETGGRVTRENVRYDYFGPIENTEQAAS